MPILVDSLSYQTRSGEISQFLVDIIEALLGLCQTLHRLMYMQRGMHFILFIVYHSQWISKTNGNVQTIIKEVIWNIVQNRARPGFEPGTSRTQSENHTPRPTSHMLLMVAFFKCHAVNQSMLKKYISEYKSHFITLIACSDGDCFVAFHVQFCWMSEL